MEYWRQIDVNLALNLTDFQFVSLMQAWRQIDVFKSFIGQENSFSCLSRNSCKTAMIKLVLARNKTVVANWLGLLFRFFNILMEHSVKEDVLNIAVANVLVTKALLQQRDSFVCKVIDEVHLGKY